MYILTVSICFFCRIIVFKMGTGRGEMLSLWILKIDWCLYLKCWIYVMRIMDFEPAFHWTHYLDMAYSRYVDNLQFILFYKCIVGPGYENWIFGHFVHKPLENFDQMGLSRGKIEIWMCCPSLFGILLTFQTYLCPFLFTMIRLGFKIFFIRS